MAEGFVWAIYSAESKKILPERGLFDTKGACQRAINNQLKSYEPEVKKNFMPKKVALVDLLNKEN